jgi:hypothetical protein
MLFAETEFLPPHLLPAMIGTLVFVSFGVLLYLVLLPAAVRLVDKHTPGNLAGQLVPTEFATTPNVALAIVVGLMLLGLINGVATIIAAAIH